MNEELAHRDLDTGLAINREPEVVLEEAHRAAAALKRVIEAKPNKVMFGGEQYLEFEDKRVARPAAFIGRCEHLLCGYCASELFDRCCGCGGSSADHYRPLAAEVAHAELG